jgi:amino acid adenylation domain-containing protein
MTERRLEQLLQTSAERQPDALAYGDASGAQISFRDMQAAVDDAAQRLQSYGIRPGDRVGLCLPKSIQTLVLVFAVLKTRAAYVPVDLAAPAGRSATIFSDCRVRAVFCSPDKAEALTVALGEAAHPVREADEPGDLGTCLLAREETEPADPSLAYILYTSGSTGRPKGVAHSHASALAFVDWCNETFAPNSQDRFSSHAPLHFDLSILDIYVPAMSAAYVRLISAEESKQPGNLTRILEEEALTFWYSTPSILKAMIDFGQLEAHDHSTLRTVCFAGEVFPPKHLRRLAAHWPQARYHNLYGPTETNVCTAFEVPDPLSRDDSSAIPIGVAASGDDLLIVDPDGTPAGPEDPGELVVNGPSVMRGYWNDEEKTAGAMLRHAGRDWYRTGDIVERDADGVLIYRGRRDRMVKKRGYRIELGEVEAALLRHESIGSGAVVAIETSDAEVALVAFHTWAGETAPSLIALKRHCGQIVPAYMIPDRFRHLDDLPYTSTDKIDYQKLKEMAGGLFTDR